MFPFRAPHPIFSYNGVDFSHACIGGHLPLVVYLWSNAQPHRFDIVNAPDEGGVPPLHWAAYHGHLPVARFLVSKGARVNEHGGDQQTTALQWAAGAGHLQVVHFLLDNGADAMATDVSGYTSMMHAVQFGRMLAAQLIYCKYQKLKGEPLDMQHLDAHQHTLAHWAAYKGFLPILQWLAEVHGVRLTALDDQDRSALHWAAREGHETVCRYLLAKGVPVNQKDKDGFTPLQWATERNHPSIARLLLSTTTTITPSLQLLQQGKPHSTVGLLRGDRDQRNGYIAGWVLILVHFLFVSKLLPVVLSLLAPALLCVSVHPRASPLQVLRCRQSPLSLFSVQRFGRDTRSLKYTSFFHVCIPTDH
eukprot:TRINITY_DN24101_c0_g1_i2.p1 TRINITY_DN24101_c0_g1~~TRINITY_DN24101_c0_g1_i2.p1  ORF type:complete len:362 (-),score=66.57 TRINITY_DN24101_c0_g1_i2:66-1151(-)